MVFTSRISISSLAVTLLLAPVTLGLTSIPALWLTAIPTLRLTPVWMTSVARWRLTTIVLILATVWLASVARRGLLVRTSRGIARVVRAVALIHSLGMMLTATFRLLLIMVVRQLSSITQCSSCEGTTSNSCGNL